MEENTYKDYEFNTYFSSYPVNLFGLNISELYDAETIKNLIKDPMSNRDVLRDLCETIYNSNGIVTNVIDYMVSLPTLDYVAIAYGETPSSKERAKKITATFLKTIRHKEVVRDIIRSVLVGGDYYGYCDFGDRPLNEIPALSDFAVRSIGEINADTVSNASIITLPVKYCKIVGYKNSAPIIAFNLDYFRSEGNESADSKIRKYPKEIRDAFQQYTNKKGASGQWHKLRTENTIAIKYRASRLEPYGRPLPLAALANVLYQDEFVATKRGIMDEFRSRVYYETFPESDKKGISTLSEPQQKKQHEALRDAFQGKGAKKRINFISLAAGTKLDSVKMDGMEILDEKYENNLRNDIAGDMGFAGALLSGAGENASYSSMEMNARLISSQIFQLVEMIAEELNKCLNANLIRSAANAVEVYYLPITYINRKEMADMARQLYLEGRGSLFYWAAATGLKPDAFMAMVMEEKDLKLDEILPIHQTSYTQSGNNEGGRPSVENPTSPSTIQTKARNSNEQPKPSKK